MEELGLCFDTWGSICSYKRKNTSCYFNRFAPPLRFFVMPPKPLNPFFAKCRVFAPLTVSWSQVLLQSYVCVCVCTFGAKHFCMASEKLLYSGTPSLYLVLQIFIHAILRRTSSSMWDPISTGRRHRETTVYSTRPRQSSWKSFHFVLHILKRLKSSELKQTKLSISMSLCFLLHSAQMASLNQFLAWSL